MEGFSGKKLKEEAYQTEKRVREVTGWRDPVEEKIGFVEATCPNYEVPIEDKRVGKTGGAGPSERSDTRNGPIKNIVCAADRQEKERGKLSSFQQSSKIEKMTNL